MTFGSQPQSNGHSMPMRVRDVENFRGRHIIDIRRDREQFSIKEEIHKGLRPEDGGEKRLPTLLLYDERGLKLFEDITYLDEYYLTNAEIEILETEADSIARHFPPDSVIVELGSGNLRKVDILLKALDRQQKNVEYFALDLSLTELERTLAAIPKGSYNHVKCFGLHGTYDDGLEWLKKPELKHIPKTILSIGSSIGNFSRPEAAAFLGRFAEVLEPTDSFLIGIDGTKDPEKVYHAYNDRHGTTHKFIASGLKHANDILGRDVFDSDVWRVIGEYSDEHGRHQAFVSPTVDCTVDGVLVKRDERVRIEESYKYSDLETENLFLAAGMYEKTRWTNRNLPYAVHMIAKGKFAFDWRTENYASTPVPSWKDWNELWSVWDVVTRHMLPEEELLEKPIKLRNECIFYLGHIPTFFDMKLAEVTGGELTEPFWYAKIFERGIDPDVDDPGQCHAHSEVPAEWPPVGDILAHQMRVRQRAKDLYESGAVHDPKIARAIWLGYEHEAMHLETLLYMLIQSEKTLPPPTVGRPNFGVDAETAAQRAVPNEWHRVPESEIKIGLDDPESTAGPSRFFLWDVEKPPHNVKVRAFEAKGRPITNGDYAGYLQQTGKQGIPAAWDEKKEAAPRSYANGHTNGHTNGHANGDTDGHTNGHTNGNIGPCEVDGVNDSSVTSFIKDKLVRTIYGRVPLRYCLDWPLSASYDEIAGCAAWMGGRIPTLEEVRSIYKYVDDRRKASITNGTQRTIPAVNGHLVNDGVEESPPQGRNGTANGAEISGINGADASSGSKSNKGNKAGPDPAETFFDLKGANVGFQHWHPTSVTHLGDQLCGQGHLGGLWEWTSTPLARIPGYEPMPLYPNYSSDFFDGKHNVVLGGSWATVPRIAGRKSFVNWYQRNYPYAWAGARIVRDL